MIFAPHVLLKKDMSQDNDEYGQPIASEEEFWTVLCDCRCDDVTTEWRGSENGEIYQTHHHVVCNGKVAISEGDFVKCVQGNELKAEGEVYKVKRCNYFNYTEIYL